MEKELKIGLLLTDLGNKKSSTNSNFLIISMTGGGLKVKTNSFHISGLKAEEAFINECLGQVDLVKPVL